MPDGLSIHDTIGGTILNDHLLAAVPGLRGKIVRRLPYYLAQLIELRVRAKHYDAVLTWSDRHAILIGAVMRFWRRRPAHVAILLWPSKPKKAIPLRLAHRGIDRLIAWAPQQRKFVETKLGISRERFVEVQPPVDTRFWRPMDAAGDMICSVGQEMRDYGTLVEALRGLEIRCHIAAGTNCFNKASDKWGGTTAGGQVLPPGVTVGPKSYAELRELYARSRFIVVPLLPSDMDNGFTTICEAFAMGKPVICTRTAGQSGTILQDGVNCLRVPPFDAGALRDMINELWSDPERCRRLGAAGRRVVENRHSLEQFRAGLERAVLQATAVRALA